MKKYFRIPITLVFIILFYLMLTHPVDSLYYAFTGLTLWFQKMIPTLFPFMVLSGIMIRMNLTEYFAAFFTPIFRRLFRVSGNGAYCILLGFLCGFPMGAKVVAELYERQKLSKTEATFLLSFCNNIGPIYFISFVLPILQLKGSFIYLFGMYGIPFLYGIILSGKTFKKASRTGELVIAEKSSAKEENLLEHVDDAIIAGIEGITRLGGYMILFNLLNLLPAMLLPARFLPAVNAIFEITSGISRIGNTAPLYVLILLPFGGLSCIAQTYSIIKNTDLSLGVYCTQKIILTLLTAIYYGLLIGIGQLFPAVSPF